MKGTLLEASTRAPTSLSSRLIETIKSLRAEGISIIWIEHIVHALLAVVDRLMAIDFGRKLIEGDPRVVMASPEVQDVYLGTEEEEL